MGIIKSLLDTDFYKLSMCSMAFHQYPGKIVKYQFICRNKEVDLTPYKEEIEKELDELVKLRFTEEEIQYLRAVKNGIFKEDYLQFLQNFKLDRNQIVVSIKDGKLSIEAEGDWQTSILWEIYVLSIVNEVYFRNTQPNASKEVGRAKLMEKVNLVKEMNKDDDNKFLFMEFGTRRRYSAQWQEEVCLILKKELLGNGFVGTSNVHLAMKLDIPVHGTMAHEAFQFHQGVDLSESTDPNQKYFKSQQSTLKAWLKEYRGDLAVALSDIFGTDAFLSILDTELTNQYTGLRHDSGDAFVWADKAISHFEKFGIDPKTKTLVFSDGLDFPKAQQIFEYTKLRTKVLFGIGTNLTNNFNFKAMNIVMKMVEADGNPVVKISDEPSKAIGDKNVIALVKKHFHIND